MLNKNDDDKCLYLKQQSIGFIQKEELTKLGNGSFGEVFSGYWTDKNGKRHLAALKKQLETEEVFDKEISSLSKVNHLFVVKYHGLVDMIDDASTTKRYHFFI